jgi:L-fuconolactonase
MRRSGPEPVIVDAHHHFWNPARGDYGWMPKGDAVLDRIYGPSDLAPHLARHGIDRTILVQAAPSIAETEYMLGIADASTFVAGVVGWVDLEQPADGAVLKRLCGHLKFKGIRPMIQDIPDDDWMLRDDLQWAYRLVCDLDISFDALGFPRHLANFLTLMKRYPEMRVVVDHCMKPQIRDGRTSFSAWAEGMARIAAETNAFCKLSALVTESNADWTVDTLRPYADHILRVFGPERIMWGSDWPVCLLRASYLEWWDAAQDLTADLPPDAQARIFGGTAAQFYRL